MNLPDSLTHIADDAFDGTSISDLTVSEGTYAWSWAVDHDYFGWEWRELMDGTVEITGCTRIAEAFSIPREIGGKRVSAVADEAFAGAPGIISVAVPGTVDRIGARAFAEIPSLKSVVVSQGVKVV